MTESEAEAIGLPQSKPAPEELIPLLQSADLSSQPVIPATIVYGLSDVTADEFRALAPVWASLPALAKDKVLRALNEASEVMFELNYREIALRCLCDESGLVRATAIELLWADESAETMRKLMDLAETDLDSAVKSSALKNLGRFILLGEYGDIPAELAARAQELTLRAHRDEGQSVEVRRRALEALANSSHGAVNELIHAAYTNGNHELKLGAIFAMGRTCNKMWRNFLLAELENADSECVFEAIRACGQVQLGEAVQRLGEYTLGDDQEIQLMAIWSLGEIGGKRAFEILARLEENVEDAGLANAIDEALDAAGFSLSFAALGLDLDDD
ncbi:MAG: HEAT repeat domain-containing protein [Chloroflexi bacterium]|nr:HEAT repeat domain-containing protein [Chloroflexota bacterium]